MAVPNPLHHLQVRLQDLLVVCGVPGEWDCNFRPEPGGYSLLLAGEVPRHPHPGGEGFLQVAGVVHPVTVPPQLLPGYRVQPYCTHFI